MLVCLCNAVPESTIRRCMEAGAGSVEAIARECGAGSDCGTCVDAIADLLVQQRAARVTNARPPQDGAPVFALT